MMSVINLQASRKPKNVTRIAPDLTRQGAPELIIQGDLFQNTLAPNVFGVVRGSAGLLDYAAGLGVALVRSPIFRPKHIGQPGLSLQGRTNVIPFFQFETSARQRPSQDRTQTGPGLSRKKS
jgi:hypothetical protein